MREERIGLAKDNGNVTSPVTAKEHMTFSHAWLESKKKLREKIMKNALIPTPGYGASLISSPFLQKLEIVA